MSIYRRPKVFSDVLEPIVRDDAPKTHTHIPPNPNSGYAPVRKSNPTNELLAFSQKWLDGIPEDVRPVYLVRYYPRIVNLLAVESKNAMAFGKLLDELLVDRRGGRKGFPPEVRYELQVLYNHYYVRLSSK